MILLNAKSIFNLFFFISFWLLSILSFSCFFSYWTCKLRLSFSIKFIFSHSLESAWPYHSCMYVFMVKILFFLISRLIFKLSAPHQPHPSFVFSIRQYFFYYFIFFRIIFNIFIQYKNRNIYFSIIISCFYFHRLINIFIFCFSLFFVLSWQFLRPFLCVWVIKNVWVSVRIVCEKNHFTVKSMKIMSYLIKNSRNYKKKHQEKTKKLKIFLEVFMESEIKICSVSSSKFASSIK